jgi:cytochrome c oxidase assembly protein subunit 15
MAGMAAPDPETAAPGWRTWRLSPHAFRAIAAAAVWALLLTIFSGAAVRLTGSGLGCPDWPNCTNTSLVAPLQYHAWIEFGNRLINAIVTIASIGAFVAALRRRPRRPDLTWLSFGLVIGLLLEVVVGALVVESKLAPGLVMTHFLLGMVFLGDAVVLHYRASIPDDALAAGPVQLVGRSQLLLSRAQLAATGLAVALGTVVTSTGPHGGSPNAKRFHFSLHSVAQLHGTSVELLLLLTLTSLWNLARTGAPPEVMRRAEIMLVAMVLQAVVGYTQYFNGDPVGLVEIHVAGASVLVVATLRYYLGLSAYSAAGIGAPTPSLAATPS